MRWFAVFDQALRSSDVIAVWRAVEQHLDRPLTGAELTLARRAANRYAVAAGIRVVRIPAPAGSGRIRTIPLLARPDADLGDVERLTGIASGTIATGARRRRTGGDVAARTESLVASVAEAARRSRRLGATRLERTQAAALAADLGAALSQLRDLQQRLQVAANRVPRED